MLKVKILVSHLDQATDEDLAEMQRFLRRQGLQIKTKARPRKGKARKTYKALLETALPAPTANDVLTGGQAPSNDPAQTTEQPAHPDNDPQGITPVNQE